MMRSYSYRRRRIHTALILGVVSVLVGACGQGTMSQARRLEESYRAAKRDAIKNVDVIREFHTIYPDAVGFFSYFTGEYGDTSWNSKAFLYGRYELTMQLSAQLSEDWRRVVDVGEPMFYLVELREINDLGDGRLQSTSWGGWEFGRDVWTKIREAEGRIEEVLTADVQKDLIAQERARARAQDAEAGAEEIQDAAPADGGGGVREIRTDAPVEMFDRYVESMQQEEGDASID